MHFTCNICLAINQVGDGQLGREEPGCPGCGSNVRIRAVLHLLSEALFGISLPLADFPTDKSIRGLGLSDWGGYAGPLAEKLDYSNTYFHQPPLLDICNVDASAEGNHDFLISSEVFEHVVAPVSRAFAGARRLLKPGGVLILTVPYSPKAGETLEHYPHLHDYAIREVEGSHRLFNTRADGTREEFTDLVFHGGPGSTLEMRLFTCQSVISELEQAGFSEVRIASEARPDWGITWEFPWSLPIVARVPAVAGTLTGA